MNKEKLTISEALELRNEYDAHLSVLKNVLDSRDDHHSFLARHSDADKKEYDDAVDIKAVEKEIKTLEYKRVKLNIEIQKANFETKLSENGKEISIIEALEMRKQLKSRIGQISSQLEKAAYKEVVHKEERDIVYRPARKFPEVYEDYKNQLILFRSLQNSIHQSNNSTKIDFFGE